MTKNEINVFNESEINEYIQKNLKGWSFDGKWIRKTYKTHSWKSTLMVVNSIGHLAEAAWHHPDLTVSYAFVIVKLQNHAAKGITEKDFSLAAEFEKVINWKPSPESTLEGTPDDQRFKYIKYDS